MKRIGLLIVLFIGFSAINGYGRGGPDPSPPENPLTGKVDGITEKIDGITEKVDGLEKRVKKLEDPSPGDPTPVPLADGLRFIPINWAIINEQEDNLVRLNYYVSQDISATRPGSVKTSTKVRDDGTLEEIKDERPAEKLVISQNDPPGKMDKYSPLPKGRESMEIFFSAKSAILTFTRNKNNCFELTSVRKDGREFDLEDEVIPTLLYIKYKGGPLGTTGRTERGRQDSGQRREPAQTARRDCPPEIIKNILLERGQGYLRRDAVIDYMQNYSSRSSLFSRSDISDLVNAYFKEAEEEWVNPEIALAQMWYATRKLSHDDLLSNYNYAGLERVGPFNVKFRNSKTGVRAHIQHLKGYASKNRPKNEIVDPRYEILVTNGYLGRGTTLGELSKWWSPNKDYAAEIIKILNTLYQYQYRYNSRR